MTKTNKFNPNDPRIQKLMEQMQSRFESVLLKMFEDDDANECVESEETIECDGQKTDECSVKKTDECGGSKKANESFERRHPNVINEMAVLRAVNSKSLANVRDAISRHNFDEQWATNVPPLSKYNDIELLNRYVAALLVFHKPCPTTMEEVDEIGVFKNYAKKMIEDGTVTLEDVQKMYDGSPALAERPRRGTARAAAGWRKAPSQDYNFDDDDAEETPAPVVEEPVDEPEPEIPAYDEDNEEEDGEFIPEPMDNETEETYDNEDVVDEPAGDEVSIEDGEDAVEQAAASGEIVEIENIEELTIDEYYDPNMNASFNAHNKTNILMENGRVGFQIRICNEDDEVLGEYTLLRNSFGRALEDYTIASQATITATTDAFYDLQITQVINVFWKDFNQKLSDDQQDEIDNKVQKLHYRAFQAVKNADDIIKALDNMDDEE